MSHWEHEAGRWKERAEKLAAALREIETVHDGLEHASGEFACPAHNHECFDAPPEEVSGVEHEAPCPPGDDHVLEMCECCLRCTLIARSALAAL